MREEWGMIERGREGRGRKEGAIRIKGGREEEGGSKGR